MKSILNIGFNNIILTERIVSVVSVNAAPVKRLIDELRRKQKVVNATAGRKVKSVIISDCGTLFLSALTPSTLSYRLSELQND